VRVSCKKNFDKIAQTTCTFKKKHARSGDVILSLPVGSIVLLTTLRAPSGVTRIAAVKANTTVFDDISMTT
jgi:hypothetical protein